MRLVVATARATSDHHDEQVAEAVGLVAGLVEFLRPCQLDVVEAPGCHDHHRTSSGQDR